MKSMIFVMLLAFAPLSLAESFVTLETDSDIFTLNQVPYNYVETFTGTSKTMAAPWFTVHMKITNVTNEVVRLRNIHVDFFNSTDFSYVYGHEVPITTAYPVSSGEILLDPGSVIEFNADLSVSGLPRPFTGSMDLSVSGRNNAEDIYFMTSKTYWNVIL